MRSITIASALLGACIASGARAQTPAPAPAPAPTETPRTEVQKDRTEQRIRIGGLTFAMRPSEDGFQEATLTADAARLFDALPAAYTEVGLTLKEVDQNIKQAGTGTFRAQFRIGKQRLSTYVDCGLDAMGLKQADNYALSMRVTTQVVPEGVDRATVRTLVQTTGRPPANSGLEIHCPTTGKLEEKIAEAIAKHAANR
jgi:hypothetical protein